MEFENTKIGWPLDSNIIRKGANGNTFGMVRYRTDGSKKPHQGWDFYAKVGTPCYSVADGKVAYSGLRSDLGLLVVISIGNTGKFAAYAHLSSSMVTVGELVMRGQCIGLTGISGNAAGMKGLDQHLHFEVRDIPLTGLGLEKRVSPIQLFKVVPFKIAEMRTPPC